VPTVWDDDPNPIIGEIFDQRGEAKRGKRYENYRKLGSRTVVQMLGVSPPDDPRSA
jgi:hypothetical protein